MSDIADQDLIDLFAKARVIAVVGLSPKPDRASFRVAAYMQQAGYRIIPVRPGPEGEEILGEPCYPTLDAIPKEIHVDIVDLFRRGEETPPLAEEAVQIGAGCLWLQSGIVNDDSMAIARQGGLLAIQDRCLMVEHRRVAGSL
ncbi:MAG: CoA-binding protein [Magnetococcales bacterium]|nr:CoA-binding protein [Magnetococcales bacterium]